MGFEPTTWIFWFTTTFCVPNSFNDIETLFSGPDSGTTSLSSLNCRELENNLRAAEILFTVTYHGARQSGDAAAVTHFSSAYFDLVQVSPAFVREIF